MQKSGGRGRDARKKCVNVLHFFSSLPPSLPPVSVHTHAMKRAAPRRQQPITVGGESARKKKRHKVALPGSRLLDLPIDIWINHVLIRHTGVWTWLRLELVNKAFFQKLMNRKALNKGTRKHVWMVAYNKHYGHIDPTWPMNAKKSYVMLWRFYAAAEPHYNLSPVTMVRKTLKLKSRAPVVLCTDIPRGPVIVMVAENGQLMVGRDESPSPIWRYDCPSTHICLWDSSCPRDGVVVSRIAAHMDPKAQQQVVNIFAPQCGHVHGLRFAANSADEGKCAFEVSVRKPTSLWIAPNINRTATIRELVPAITTTE